MAKRGETELQYSRKEFKLEFGIFYRQFGTGKFYLYIIRHFQLQYLGKRKIPFIHALYWAFSIYKKIRKFSIGNFRLGKRVAFVTSPILGRPGR